MRLTAKERILLHLQDSRKGARGVEVSSALTQEGIAQAASIDLRHFMQYARPLVRAGLINERTAHVRGLRQRRKVYELTDTGRMEAARLRTRLSEETVRVREGSIIRARTVGEILNDAGGKPQLLAILREHARMGVVDPSALPSALETAFVEMLAGAPRIETFVGRRSELKEITREDEQGRLFLVRGIAGIGKTSLAAKACEILRGKRNLFWHRIRPWDTRQTLMAHLGDFLDALARPGLKSVLGRGHIDRAVDVLRYDLPGTRSFLVFDDAQEAPSEAIPFFRMLAEGLLGAADVRVLILSRQVLPFYDRRNVVLEKMVREIELRGLDTEDAAALLAAGGDPVLPAGLGRRLAGHPLFLELVRSHRPHKSEALDDVDRFIEEEISRRLSDVERAIMKRSSLFEIPVPRDVVLSAPGSSFETLLSLQDRCLIRPTGGGRYEIHDTIRDFFAGALSPEERRAFGEIAVTQLRSLASKAWDSGDMTVCVSCLSNALSLTQSRGDRRALLEALGDAQERIGDLLGVSASYREGMKLTKDPEVLARLHRKLASALEDRGQLKAASVEGEQGFACLGDMVSIERAWLDLIKARIASENYDHGAAEASAERALRTFERFGSQQGKAQALLELGISTSWTGTQSEDGAPFSEGCLRSALELGVPLGDPELATRIHIAMASLIGYGTGDFEDGLRHFSAAESMLSSKTSLRLRATLLVARARFLTQIALDFAGAEHDLSEALRIARKIHDDQNLAEVAYQFAVIASLQGSYGEAGHLFEEAGSGEAQAGLMGPAVDSLHRAAYNYLANSNRDGHDRVVSTLRDSKMAQGIEHQPRQTRIAAGLESLLHGDEKGFETAFREYFRQLEALPEQSFFRIANAWWGHFYYSVGLRALGRDQEADIHHRRAGELLRVANNRSGLHVLDSDFGDGIVQTIRNGWTKG